MTREGSSKSVDSGLKVRNDDDIGASSTSLAVMACASGKSSIFDKYADELTNNDDVKTEISEGRRIGFYRLLNNIGSGNFSQVKLATHVITREKVAVKILDKMKLSSKTQRLLSREISSMERLQHPHIIRLYEVMETMTKLYMVIEYAAGGELFTRITTRGRMKETEAKMIFAQLVSAVTHMHDKHVIHRDIKAENVFITYSLFVKIGDFGFSTLVRPDQTLNTFCGSPPYAAPELFKDDYYIGWAVDVWALGVLLYFIVTAETPFRAETVGKLKHSILSGVYSIPVFVSPQCNALITNILRQNPSERFSMQQIRECEWLEGQIFPLPYDSFEINPRVAPSNFSTGHSSQAVSFSTPSLEMSEHDCFTSDETEAYRQLRHLGITNDHVVRSRGRASRSSVTGIYRIVLHQLQKKRSKETVNFAICEDEEESTVRKVTKSSKACSFL